MASTAASAARTQAKPILSATFAEARRRALNLYRAWYREVGSLFIRTFSHGKPSLFEQIPHMIETYALDMPVRMARHRLREEFVRNSHVRDPRVIDMLVVKARAISISFYVARERFRRVKWNWRRLTTCGSKRLTSCGTFARAKRRRKETFCPSFTTVMSSDRAKVRLVCALYRPC